MKYLRVSPKLCVADREVGEQFGQCGEMLYQAKTIAAGTETKYQSSKKIKQ